MITSEEIKSRLWDGANELRGSMDASRYKDYMLGLMFYKFLSDKTLETFKKTAGLGEISENYLVKEYEDAVTEYGEELIQMIQDVLGYYVLPEYLYQRWLIDIDTGDFEVQKVTDSLNHFEHTIAITNDSTANDFKGIFATSTIDLTDSALGSDLNERSKNIKALILLFADLNMVSLQKGDVLGDAYEYLIGQFAMESGKKAGEFYTPQQVSEVMAQIVAKSSNIQSMYDPTVGSGSLLLTVKKHLSVEEQKNLNYYGQEKNTATFNLTRMNLLLHGVRPEKMTIRNADTLSHDWPEDPNRPSEGVQFDAVVMNPPYSAKNWNRSELKVSDPRFEIAGVLPPDSKGDLAFLLHGLYHLGQNGTMAIVLPHGVLFRGGAEGVIRERLLEKNYIDTVIGLPNNLFTNTGIPVAVIILKKNRELGDPVLFIDSSHHFVKVGKQNVLQEKDIARIVDTYTERIEINGYSHLATRKEILENEYNLNIPRYVETKEDEFPHDVDGHLFGGIPKKDIEKLNVLNSLTGDVLQQALKEIRPGYVELIESIEEMKAKVFNHSRIVELSTILQEKVANYISKYWEILRNVDKTINIKQLSEEMLLEIKNILATFDHVDFYSGYQIIAEIWKQSLTHDIELIANSEFYSVARTREPNMVSKGTGKKKRIEQDGWIGTIVPNHLIEEQLYANDLKEIEKKKFRLTEVEMSLSDLVEAAKVEDTEENSILADTLKKSEEGELGDSFEAKAIKVEVKKTHKGTDEYHLLKKVEKLLSEKSSLNKEIKKEEKELKDAVQNRILILTNEEIDQLVYEKWFGNVQKLIVDLIKTPLVNELKSLEMLIERYSETLSSIDEEISQLEKSLELMLNDLVVDD